MKLFIAALAVIRAEDPAQDPAQDPAEEQVVPEDVPAVVCPTGWEAGADADECKPKNVDVQCDATKMTVTFPIDAVYFDGSNELSDAQKTEALVDIVDQTDPECVNFEYAEGVFTVEHSLTGCGTEADHDAENNQLVFTNSYIGDEAALTVDGIITTKVLSFQAQCTYSDSATVSIDDVSISMGTNIAETVSDTGSYTFSMATYDADGDALSAENQAEIGDQVTLKITPNTDLPDNVEFHLVDCVAAEGFDDEGAPTGKSYNIIESGSCVSKLLEAQFDGSGKSNTDVSLDFNSFTFAADDDELDIKCNLKLCLSTDTDCFADVQETAEAFECGEKYQRSEWYTSLE